MPIQIKQWSSLFFTAYLMVSSIAHADRIKDLASIQGVRSNQLIGYGLVVGLDGTGDQTTQTPFTVQSLQSMLQQMGVNLPPGTSLQLKNVASVLVSASLPAFAQPGQNLDVTVSSMGNAKSLNGGTLLMTPLKGADNQVYAMAQGSLIVGGVGASSGGSQTLVNHLSVGRISAGATVEKALVSNVPKTDTINIELRETDFSTASLVVDALNKRFGDGTAEAVDARVIRVKQSAAYSRIAFIAAMEAINVNPAQGQAKIILNARTGSIVINQLVTLDACAVSHGNLTVTITNRPVISQPAPKSRGVTVVDEVSSIDINKEPGNVLQLPKGASLSAVVKSLNAIGASPQDLLSILQAMKASGALHAEIEVI